MPRKKKPARAKKRPVKRASRKKPVVKQRPVRRAPAAPAVAPQRAPEVHHEEEFPPDYGGEQ